MNKIKIIIIITIISLISTISTLNVKAEITGYFDDGTPIYSMITVKKNVNVRNEAGNNNKKVFTLLKGNKYHIIKTKYVGSTPWYKIQYEIGKYGYVIGESKYVSYDTNRQVLYNENSHINITVKNGKTVTVYKKPNGSIINTIKGYENQIQYYVYEETFINNDLFYTIKNPNMNNNNSETYVYGYIKRDDNIITVQQSSRPKSGYINSGKILTVVSTKLNVREKPKTNSKKIDTLYKGNTISIYNETKIENGNTWYKVVTKNNQTGYVLGTSKYVKISKHKNYSNIKKGSKLKILVQGIPVYAGPTEENQIVSIEKIGQNNSVLIKDTFEVDGVLWAKVEYFPGKIGYVAPGEMLDYYY